MHIARQSAGWLRHNRKRKMADQKTDNDQGVSPNMTLNTTSKSPKTTGEGTAYRGTDPISDNNGHLGFGVKERRNKG